GGADLVPLAMVRGSPRCGGIRAHTRPREAVPVRGRAYVRRVRCRRVLLLGDAHGTALVGGRTGPVRGRPGAQRAPDDDRVRPAGLGSTMGPSIPVPWRKPACRHALAAYRDVNDGRTNPLGDWPGRRRRRMG